MRISRNGAGLLVQTPAKVNLSLKVLGKREDGFHDLETLMLSVRLYDCLAFFPNETHHTQLTADSSITYQHQIPADENNLIVKAANLIREVTGCASGVDIHLTKKIPSEAGLGGGSSDAAATLLCLNRLWGLNLSIVRLHELAAQLGSDVNFFIDSSVAAMCTGRGEQVKQTQLTRPLNLVLLKPISGLSTAKVFENLNLEAVDVGQESDCQRDLYCGLRSLSQGILNSLETPARVLNPDIDHALKLLERHDVLASGMSGSGTACFGVCRSRRHAQVIASRIRAQTNMQVWSLRTGV